MIPPVTLKGPTYLDRIDLFVSIGQSNESGRGSLTSVEEGIPQVTTLGNDYRWKMLQEPTDSIEGQVDAVSKETTTVGHSSLVKLGKILYAATGRRLTIIPNAKGATKISAWQAPATRFDRTTLFGSADYRTDLAIRSGRELKAFLWYQGEHDALGTSGDRDNYISNHQVMVQAWRDYYGAKPFFYAQLAAQNREADTNWITVREYQRRMETGSGYHGGEIYQHYMIVAHDLSMGDDLHLDTAGLLAFAERRALAIRKYVYGEDVNATGPRLVSITQPTSTTIKVKTTSEINDHSDYDNYFTVYDDGTPVVIDSMGRDSGDNTAVEIVLDSTPSGTVTVAYQPPTGRATGARAENVVKDSDELPLPAFGPIELFG